MKHSHKHLHAAQHEARQFGGFGNNPFGQELSQLAGGINSFFGGGNNGGQAGGAAAAPTPQPAQNNPSPAQQQQQQNTPAARSDPSPAGVSIVYVTQSFTGTGEYSLSTQVPTPRQTSKSPDPVQTSDDSSSTTLRTRTKSSASAATTTAAAAATTSSISSAIMSSISSSGTTAAPAAATTSASATAADQGSGGLSGGAKAGIAIGVIIGILALVAGAFALYRMKQQRDEEAYERASSSEKNPFSDHAAAPPPPVMGGMAAAPAPASNPTPGSASYQPGGQPSAVNPFGPAAVVNGTTPVSVSTGPVLSGPHGAGMASGMAPSGMAGAGIAGGMAGAAIGAGAVAATTQSKPNSVPPPLNVNRSQSPALAPPPVLRPSSPANSAFSESSTMTAGMMAAAGGVGAGVAGGPRMHRVQMDFNPTMDDELGIKAGEVVRIVREFDDGWCSVEVVQRDAKGNVLKHQQGVVPRTCLSRLPLKPRQKRAGAPVAVNNGPQTRDLVNGSAAPNNGQGAGRAQSPALVANRRSKSPGPYGGGPQDRPQQQNRNRSNSAGDANGLRPKVSNIGSSPMNPASQVNKEVELPIQVQSPTAPVSPVTVGHSRAGSGGSSASVPVSRKPVPKRTDA